jgi:DNA-binding NarL/FixJ family response regulator
VVDEVSNCAELMSQLNNQVYTHLILDLIMPDGNALEIIENINNLYPNLTILIHSMQPVEVYGKILRKYKVHSYLYKGVSESEIKKHIESFIKLEDLSFSKQFDKDSNPFSSLAVRELEVLHYLLNGYRTKEISTTLGLKMNTISTIKAVIFDKVKADNFTHLLQLAHVHQISY